MQSERLIQTGVDDTSGRWSRYVNLDNAATTPVAAPVWEAVRQVVEIYGSVHRGSGEKSILCTEVYERAKQRLKQFVRAGDDDVVALSCNSTMAINRFARSYRFKRGQIVLVSEMEHSSNDLPWRSHATVIRVASLPSGAMDLNDLEAVLKRHGRKVRLVAVTGASNVNGFLTPLPDVAAITHRHGAEVFVDAAQLAAHRPMHLRTGSEAEIDYVAFSGHKMYAPFGVGVVIGRRKAFKRTPPDVTGGGTIEMLTADHQIWSHLDARLNPGSPNLIGLVAMAAAAEMIESLGYEQIRRHEQQLLRSGLEMFAELPGVKLHGQSMFLPSSDRLPIFPFTMPGIPSGKVAAILGHEHGIAVRQGHLCQYEFMRRELGVTSAMQRQIEQDLKGHDKSTRYGMVRASCGLGNAPGDLYALGDALRAIVAGEIGLEYAQDRATGEYHPVSGGNDPRTLAPPALNFLFKDQTTNTP